jgi:transcriptional regulator with XRE-family HTH domain
MQPVHSNWVEIMATDDKEFFVALGLRIAQLRRERGWSQQELADKLGVAQQTLAHYEVARIRVPASTLPLLSTLFMTPIDTLVGHTQHSQRTGKRGPTPKWQQQIETIAQLPKAQQRFVTQVLDSVLAQAQSGR